MYDSLHRNLRLWSVTPNESSFGKIGHDESGSKQEFISFYNFLATERWKVHITKFVKDLEDLCTEKQKLLAKRAQLVATLKRGQDFF